MAAERHQDQVAELRRRIKAVAPRVSVKMSTGTAWGNVRIRGTGEFGDLTPSEKTALGALGLDGAAYCIIMYADVDYYLKKITGRLTALDIEAARRRAEYSYCD